MLASITNFRSSVADIPSFIYPDNSLELSLSSEKLPPQPSDMNKQSFDSVELEPPAEPANMARPSNADIKPHNDPTEHGPPAMPSGDPAEPAPPVEHPGNPAKSEPPTKPPGDLYEPEPPVERPPFHAPWLTNFDYAAIQDFDLGGFQAYRARRRCVQRRGMHLA
jgi:hypothetical protein